RARQARTIGRELMLRLRAGSAVPTPLVVPPGVEHLALPDAEADAAAAAIGEAVAGLWEWGAGSNNWAVHGSRTASGKPLVAGDPFAGVPGFPHFAHNARVAWCITHAGADYQDLFVERFKPGDPGRYEYRGEWLEAERRRETIAVRGGEPVEIDVTVTRHGPIVLGDPASGHALAMRYSATAAPNAGFRCFLPMLRASSVDELDPAMRDWVDPCN